MCRVRLAPCVAAILVVLLVLEVAGGAAPAAAGASCDGRSATIVGTPQNDLLLGGPAPDVVAALGGHDVVRGRAGDDHLCGGPGRDRVFGGPGDDVLVGGGHADVLFGGPGSDALRGGPGRDACFLGAAGAVSSCAPVVAAAGDIACDPESGAYNGGDGTADECRMRAVSDLLVGTHLSRVLTLGDNQYQDGALWKFQQSYDTSWGRRRDVTRPTPGNHDYRTPDADGYFAYFGDAAGNPSRGYYRFRVGRWQLFALNSNCDAVGGCHGRSRQVRWLRKALRRHPSRCSVAYFHHPRFSSGAHGDDPSVSAFWRTLYRRGADLVLSGHDHDYERFARLRPNGARARNGIREFVVGTGGASLRGFDAPRRGSQVRRSEFGVLFLSLHPRGYTWAFVGEAGDSVDLGRARCR